MYNYNLKKEDVLKTPDECSTCIHWHVVEQHQIVIGDPKQGQCWRFPPVMMAHGNQVIGVLPHTISNFICGEYNDNPF